MLQTCWGSGPCLVCPTIPLLFLSINFYQFLVHGHGQGEQIHSSSLVSWPEMMSGGGGGISSSGQGVRRSNLVGCISSILLLFLALLIIPWYLLLLLLLSYLYLSLLCNSFFLCSLLFPFLLSIPVPGPSTRAWPLARYHPRPRWSPLDQESAAIIWEQCRALDCCRQWIGAVDGGVETTGGGEDGTQPRLSLRCCSRHAGPLQILSIWLGQTHLNLTPGMLLSLSCRIFAKLKSFMFAKMASSSFQ